jgi:hypothetical protein
MVMMGEERTTTILVRLGEPHTEERRLLWGRRVAGWTGAQRTRVSPAASIPTGEVLDLAAKQEVHQVVTGFDPPGRPGEPVPPADSELGLLVRRCPTPVLTVPPWAGPPPSTPEVAVVGVDESSESRAAARAAARLLAASRSRALLILAHGCATHPAELAARTRTRWSELAVRMSVERHPWLARLAHELRGPALGVDVISRLTFAPDLVAGLARRAGADLVALGASPRIEGRRARLGAFHRRVLRGTPLPLLTATPTARAGA